MIVRSPLKGCSRKPSMETLRAANARRDLHDFESCRICHFPHYSSSVPAGSIVESIDHRQFAGISRRVVLAPVRHVLPGAERVLESYRIATVQNGSGLSVIPSEPLEF